MAINSEFLFSWSPSQDISDYQAIIFYEDHVLCRSSTSCDQFFIEQQELKELELSLSERYPVGLHNQTACFVMAYLGDPQQPLEGYEWRSLRSLLGVIPDDYFNWVGRASQLLSSSRDHQFCGRCGNQTQLIVGECLRRCDQCKKDYYPRLSPCVIMVLTRGEYCLLARHVRFNRLFTALAGFVEPGESIEQAVAREIKEEVGITIGKVEYKGSQPWPFPGQLMLGFHAEYKSGDIIPEAGEIAEADWFRYDELPPHPDTRTLSGQLIQKFVMQFK